MQTEHCEGNGQHMREQPPSYSTTSPSSTMALAYAKGGAGLSHHLPPFTNNPNEPRLTSSSTQQPSYSITSQDSIFNGQEQQLMVNDAEFLAILNDVRAPPSNINADDKKLLPYC